MRMSEDEAQVIDDLTLSATVVLRVRMRVKMRVRKGEDEG